MVLTDDHMHSYVIQVSGFVSEQSENVEFIVKEKLWKWGSVGICVASITERDIYLFMNSNH